MSVKMQRRRRQQRLKQVRRIRREDALFFGRGVFPASARAFASCVCGAQAFSRSAADLLIEEFYDRHAYCDDEASA